MLVLNRHEDESIIIEDTIEITVLEIRGRKSVRLGITAPNNIKVYRKELYEIIKQEQE